MTLNAFFTSKTNNLSRYYNISAALIILFILILFYRDVVFAGRTFLMETATAGTLPNGPAKYKGVTPGFVANDPLAISLQIEPFNRFVSKSIKRGDLPLWNPYGGVAGNPLLADGHTGPLEPLQFLFFFVPDRYWTYAVDVQLLLRFFLAGFFCYLFARRIGIGFLGSVSAGALFMLSSYLVTSGNHPQVKTEILLPLVLYGYDRLSDSKDGPGFWFCALFIGWAIIAAMPESTFFALFLGTLWFFYKSIFGQGENHQILEAARRSSARYIGSTVLGFLISAAYLVPFLEYVTLSVSAHSTSSEINLGGNVASLWSIFSVIFPVKDRYFVHFGIVALFVLVFSFFSFRDQSTFRPAILFFGTYAAFSILTIFNFPLTTWVQKLPVFDRIVLYKYPVLSVAFCLALLSGIFVEEAHTKLAYKKVSITWLILLLIFIGLPSLYDPQRFSLSLPDNQVIYVSLCFFIGISFALFFLTFLIKTACLKNYMLQAILFLILVIEPFYWWETLIKRPTRYDPYFQHIPSFIHYLKNDNGIYRIFAIDSILFPNISTAYEIFDTRWLNPLMPERVYDFTARFITSQDPKTMRFTGSALPISDEMFKLLNVKYILRQNSYIEEVGHCSVTTAPQPYFGQDTLHSLIIEQNRSKKDSFPGMPVRINGTGRMSIFAHPPDKFDLVISVPGQSSSLNFSIGLDPSVFQMDRGDGVDFIIEVLDNKNQLMLFNKYIDPKNDPCHRKWFDEAVSLNQWAGKEITLRFSTNTGPKQNNYWDWAYWGDIRLSTSRKTDGVGHALFYEAVHQDANVEIFQNKAVYPRAFVVYDIINVSSFDQALDLLTNSDIDLRQTAIVENFPSDSRTVINESTHQNPPSGSAHVKRITPDALTVDIQTNSPGLLVMSEQYYPGWRAYIDGKETPIYAVNGILRGVFLNKGKYTVRLEYKPLSFSIGLVISVIALIATIARLVHLYRQSLQVEQ